MLVIVDFLQPLHTYIQKKITAGPQIENQTKKKTQSATKTATQKKRKFLDVKVGNLIGTHTTKKKIKPQTFSSCQETKLQKKSHRAQKKGLFSN